MHSLSGAWGEGGGGGGGGRGAEVGGGVAGEWRQPRNTLLFSEGGGRGEGEGGEGRGESDVTEARQEHNIIPH